MKKNKQALSEKRQPVNWDELHRRLDATRQAIEHIGVPAGEDKKRILRERARLLAREEDTTLEQDSLSIIEFQLAYEHYGIESIHVKEVYYLKDLTPLPGAPPFVVGIINIRGEIWSVVDLKKIFGLPDQGLPEFNKVIIIQNAAMKFGIVTDAIIGKKNVPLASIKPPPVTLSGILAEYLIGVTNEPLIILNAEKMLTDKRMIVDEHV